MSRSGGLSPYCMGLLLMTMFGQTSNIMLHLPTRAYMALSQNVVDMSKQAPMIEEPPLSIVNPADGTTVETGYARAAIGLGDPQAEDQSWAESGISGIVNISEIRFPTATYSWGSLKFWALLDDDEYKRGNVLAYGALSEATIIAAGDTIIVPPGSIRISLDSYDMEW